MSSQGFEPVSEILFDEREHRRKIAQKLNGVLQGKFNCTLDVVVTSGAATTTITDVRISPFSWIGPMAMDFDGQGDVMTGVYFDTFNNGSCVMHHRIFVGVRTLRLAILG